MVIFCQFVYNYIQNMLERAKPVSKTKQSKNFSYVLICKRLCTFSHIHTSIVYTNVNPKRFIFMQVDKARFFYNYYSAMLHVPTSLKVKRVNNKQNILYFCVVQTLNMNLNVCACL